MPLDKDIIYISHILHILQSIEFYLKINDKSSKLLNKENTPPHQTNHNFFKNNNTSYQVSPTGVTKQIAPTDVIQ